MTSGTSAAGTSGTGLMTAEKRATSGTGVLYEYGNATDSLSARGDGYVSVDLTVNFPLFGNSYSSFYLYNRGYLDFSRPSIVPFYAAISTAISGNIYYRQSADPSLLANATQDINTYFPGLGFSAQWVFIATWDKVPQYQGNASQVNTFQVVLITDGTISFVLFNYADIQWTSNAEAALLSGNAAGYYQLNTSGSSFNWTSSSNTNYPGRWAFRVDRLQIEVPALQQPATTALTTPVTSGTSAAGTSGTAVNTATLAAAGTSGTALSTLNTSSTSSAATSGTALSTLKTSTTPTDVISSSAPSMGTERGMTWNIQGTFTTCKIYVYILYLYIYGFLF
uniref:NIDO domain-containing protein n=1 Tax=Xenopus tropicalis TaxID=8364 RepID=A0A803JCE3_XENTR